MEKMKQLGVFACVLCLTFVFAAGCAKKQVLQGEAAAEKQAAAESQVTTGKTAPTAEELAAREKALKEQALKEQALKEQAEKDKLARERAAAEKAAKELPMAKEGEVLADIRFDFDSSSLTPESRAILQKHAEWLTAHPDSNLVIEGHCDDRGTTEYNLALGERRAMETMNYLLELGIDKARIKTISYGEEVPLDPAENEAAWAKNRRAHFVVNPKK